MMHCLGNTIQFAYFLLKIRCYRANVLCILFACALLLLVGSLPSVIFTSLASSMSAVVLLYTISSLCFG